MPTPCGIRWSACSAAWALGCQNQPTASRDRSAPVHVFTPALDRAELVGRRLQAVAEKLCGGSWTPLLTHLVQGQRLSERDRNLLRQLIHDHDAPAAKKERRGKEHA